MKKLFLFFIAFQISHIYAQNCDCKKEFDFLIYKIENDYAGFKDKVNSETLNGFQLYSDAFRIRAENTNTFLRCTMLLNEWLDFFNDKHLSLNIESNIYFTYKRIDSTALLLRIPDFSWSDKEMIDSLVLKNISEIKSTPILIIDLRGNGGGTDYSYQELLPLIYTNPYESKGVEWWASQGNIDYFQKAIDENNLKKGKEEETRIFLDSLKNHSGSFVQTDRSDTVIMDSVYVYPRLVGIIVDDYCASSCEQFILSAKSSSKSIIFGTRTLGVLDYSNVVPDNLLTEGLSLRYPMTRSARLPEMPIDNIGISPDVEIHLPINLNVKSEIDDWVIFVNDYLKRKLGEI